MIQNSTLTVIKEEIQKQLKNKKAGTISLTKETFFTINRGDIFNDFIVIKLIKSGTLDNRHYLCFLVHTSLKTRIKIFASVHQESIGLLLGKNGSTTIQILDYMNSLGFLTKGIQYVVNE